MLKVSLRPGMDDCAIGNAVYKLGNYLFEVLGGFVPTSGFRGNGHHAAQELATCARNLWLKQGGRLL